MSLSTYLLFLPACFAINMAFGPNNLLSVTNGARHGVSPAVIAASGRLVAFALMIAVAGLGMGAVLVASELAFDVIKYIGAAYLVWIGIRLLRAPAPTADVQSQGTAAPPSLRALARQEFTVAAGNPKAILVFTAFFPQFVVPGAYASSYVLLGTTFLVFELVAIALYAMLGARMRRLANGSRAMRWFNKVSGSMMVGFGLILALTRRPTA
ncbi:threonine/homoserine/homoserine lactone efflux protein [Variovorax boronicumulans]|uniref:Threonine/homoserine/homoserine lactone efflux protein n=1 Tax=Variovorax boronicumulans TaxID=436515 RepID=A0AAW8CZT1_9BURK|nr:LysE family translocator [Variovorax boronicumulans]MDP9893371.1 threonine/homoserine/homoserine lactone efflux protein [Variovorax boronicumulans]MDQ0053515.1 threonine/homoserine/homoserine lactone efflux protein [Variovorax boronicumulans]